MKTCQKEVRKNSLEQKERGVEIVSMILNSSLSNYTFF
jgi:hypothetical protein